jgi:hypothetical protein
MPPGSWKVLTAEKSHDATSGDRHAARLVRIAPSITTPRASCARVAPRARHVANRKSENVFAHGL